MFEIRLARESDKPEILSLLREIFDDETADRAARRWDWQWNADPRLSSPGYSGFVIEWRGSLIASIAMMPAGLFLKGKAVEAIWLAESFVHRHRLKQAVREARKAGLMDQCPDFSNGLIGAILNHEDCPRYQLGKHLTDAAKVGCYKVGATDQPGTGSWTRLISLKGLLASYIGRLPGGLLGRFIDLFLPGIPRAKYEAEPLAGPFDQGFDALWHNAIDRHEAITRRDADFLNWRYRQNPDTEYHVKVVRDGEAVRGYIVYSTFARHGQLRAHVMDFLVENDDVDLLASVFIACLRHLKQEGITKIECYTGSSVAVSVLSSLGFRQRFHKGNTLSTLVRRIDVTELYVTRGDGDGG